MALAGDADPATATVWAGEAPANRAQPVAFVFHERAAKSLPEGSAPQEESLASARLLVSWGIRPDTICGAETAQARLPRNWRAMATSSSRM